jgi:hypothetical protein
MQAMRFSSGSMVVPDAAVLRAYCKKTDPSCTYPRAHISLVIATTWRLGFRIRTSRYDLVVVYHSYARNMLTESQHLGGSMVHTLRSRTTTTGTTLPTLFGSSNLQALASVQRAVLPAQPARSKSQNNLPDFGRTSLRLSVCNTRKYMLLARVMLASTSLVSTLKTQRGKASLTLPQRHRR